MEFPGKKKFAFTIIDDTDYGTLENTQPVYELLNELGFKTTKTVWVFPPDKHHFEFFGDALSRPEYLDFIQTLQKQGFEIALHGVKSGYSNSNQILQGLKIFRDKLGCFPQMHINHAHNSDNLYWGMDRFSWIPRNLGKLLGKYTSSGHNPQSQYFWGDLHKKKIKYIRNYNFKDLNTRKSDPYFPYFERRKEKYTNYWFSCTDGGTLSRALQVFTPENIDRLEREGGIGILYVHFGNNFANNGQVHPEFKKSLEHLAQKQTAWLVPAGEILDFLLEKKFKKNHYLTFAQKMRLEFRYFRDQLFS